MHPFRRDIWKTINRYGVFETELTVDAKAPDEETARKIFAERPETAIFCHGHTHRPTMQTVSERLLVNGGTWFKRLHRRDGIIGLFPPVFYSSFQLCAVRIAEEFEQVIVEFEAIEKPSPGTEELTLTELLLTLGQNPKIQFPGRAVVADMPPESTPEVVE